MKIYVERATDANLWRRMASTQGHKVTMPWAKALKCGHSIIRATTYAVFCENIPRYVAEHLRTHFSISPIVPEEYAWMQSKRPDRGGRDFRVECYDFGQRLDYFAECLNQNMADDEHDAKIAILDEMEKEVKSWPDKFERFAPCNFNFTVSAEGLMSLSHLRLCSKASLETRQVMQTIRDEVAKIDPDLAKHMVPQCIYRGGICPEEKCCGYNLTNKAVRDYKDLFNKASLLTIHEQQWLGVKRFLIHNDECSVMLDIFDEPRRGDVKALIWSLWVSPESRRKGLCAALMNIAEEIARRENQMSVDLDWHPKEADEFVLAWYKRRGYKEQYENLEGEKHLRLQLKNNNNG